MGAAGHIGKAVCVADAKDVITSNVISVAAFYRQVLRDLAPAIDLDGLLI